jgi:hypothetical protein
MSFRLAPATALPAQAMKLCSRWTCPSALRRMLLSNDSPLQPQ